METNNNSNMNKALKLSQSIMANIKISDEEAEYKEPVKHTPTPYSLKTGTQDKFTIIKVGKYRIRLNYNYDVEQEKTDAEFIVTACNSYEALKQQNEELKEVLMLILAATESDNYVFLNASLQKQIPELLTKYEKK